MAINRRDFMALLPAASVAVASTTNLKASELADGTWNMSWVERVKGKNRAVFDSPQIEGGSALFRAVLWGRQYRQVYGTAPAEMTSVLVVRHEGIVLAMNDEFWKTYGVGKRNKMKDGAKKRWIERNPVATSAPGAPPDFADINLPRFMADGNIVLACGMAFQGVVDTVMKQDKSKKEEADKKARSLLVPGVILQPSGIFAALRAQEAGCHYILGS